MTRGRWAAQQLAEFLAAVSRASDEETAAQRGIEHVAEILGAECAALVRGGAVIASTGWPRFEVPEHELAALAAGEGDGTVAVPGAGRLPATVVGLDGGDGGHLVVARIGRPLDGEEGSLLYGMGRGLALTTRLLNTVAAERALRAQADRQATENIRLLEALRNRQRVLEAMARIQRAISRREPLDSVLETIVSAAGHLLGSGDDMPALMLIDPADPGHLRLAAMRGFDDMQVETLRRRPIGEGISGRAVAEDRLVVAEDYPASPDALPTLVEQGVKAAMAAPVHEDDQVIGVLLLCSRREDRVFTRAEQDMLQSFAEHASLALTDARCVDAMLHQALHDSLTGLPNRALFTDRLEHALVQGRRRGTTTGVVFLDLDRFKMVNDSLGHSAGDELLVTIARRIERSLRSADTAARLGGDEFAILLEDLAGIEEAELVAKRVIEAIERPATIAGREVAIGASAGIAVGGSSASDLLRQADVAMYGAKAQGRGRYVVFEESMEAEVVERLELESELLRAIERDEIEVHYQPVIALDGRTLAGFEALARWRHRERGLISPAQFIPLAEENGSIIALGRHVLRTACRQGAEWLKDFPDAIMTVNLSGRQLEHPDIVADVAGALADSGLPPAQLVLEITETVLMRDTEAMIARMQALKRLGVRLAVDDFGTGYSSLRYLRRFPVDILKMAKPFVDGLETDDEGRALARAIVEMASSLNLACIAEGIEGSEQVRMLHEMGCELGQGFHFARPMTAGDLDELLHTGADAFSLPEASRARS